MLAFAKASVLALAFRALRQFNTQVRQLALDGRTNFFRRRIISPQVTNQRIDRRALFFRSAG